MSARTPSPHDEGPPRDRHDHAFGQERRRCGERRTWIVIVLTAVTMVAEIAAGLLFGSMALLADGLHMASHACALGIAAFAYAYTRRHARDPRFSFGTGKTNALGAYTSAVLLAVFAVFVAWESVERFLDPVAIDFDAALVVAVVGLAVNAASAVVLGAGHGPEGGHDHGHAHEHAHGHAHGHGRGHGTAADDGRVHHLGHEHDHNLRAAYFHVLADAVTSLAAIGALLAGKYLGASWLDPVMGVVGALLIARWSWILLKGSGRVLLDRQAPDEALARLRTALEMEGDDRVVDLHLWEIGPGIRAAAVTVVAQGDTSPATYRSRIPDDLHVVHATIEVDRTVNASRAGGPGAPGRGG